MTPRMRHDASLPEGQAKRAKRAKRVEADAEWPADFNVSQRQREAALPGWGPKSLQGDGKGCRELRCKA